MVSLSIPAGKTIESGSEKSTLSSHGFILMQLVDSDKVKNVTITNVNVLIESFLFIIVVLCLSFCFS